ncbi:hypothetical protein ACH5RR_017745 [Cinchona calisaya]|uniref:Protein kinase domain-containing protein n=1 Tax=Cinchona calisaya TaxID=153742 RepID=A0ABD2ZL82_9GENT
MKRFACRIALALHMLIQMFQVKEVVAPCGSRKKEKGHASSDTMLNSFGNATFGILCYPIEKSTKSSRYMSPEYVIHGLYSTKSDVFSFGVLVLEIVTGRKNRDFCPPDDNLNLLGHSPEDRPTMSSVLSMSDSENTMLPQLNQPGFVTERRAKSTEDSSKKEFPVTNDMTTSILLDDIHTGAAVEATVADQVAQPHSFSTTIMVVVVLITVAIGGGRKKDRGTNDETLKSQSRISFSDSHIEYLGLGF